MLAMKKRLERLSDRSGACWIWTGSRDREGYGLIKIAGRRALAHRVSYETHVGLIPDGLEIDHLCRVRACINPAHLEPVTKSENQRRAIAVIGPRGAGAINATKTHCPQGHEYTPENTYLWRQVKRLCRTCRTERRQRRT